VTGGNVKTVVSTSVTVSGGGTLVITFGGAREGYLKSQTGVPRYKVHREE
jgi:hypothetical protein